VADNTRIEAASRGGVFTSLQKKKYVIISGECICITQAGWDAYHGIWDVYRDDFDQKMPWRVRGPRGIFPFYSQTGAVEFAQANIELTKEG